MKVVLVPADIDKELELVEPKSLEALQSLVGGYIERVTIGDHRTRTRWPVGQSFVVMLVDEEGLLKDKATNIRASLLYGTQVHGQRIAGDAVIIGEDLVFGEDGPDMDFVDLPLQYQAFSFWQDYFDYYLKKS